MATSTNTDDLRAEYRADVADRAPFANGKSHECAPELSRR